MAKSGKKIVARNRKARHDYEILEDWEAGLVLTGTEVKSLRQGTASIAEAYVRARANELYLVEAHIPPYSAGNIMNHDETRPRKLLLHRREIDSIIKELDRGSVTCIPLQLYFRDGYAKCKIGLARRRKKWDKRRKKEREQYKRDAQREMRRMKR
jgi:SsrA-binding protein